MDCSSTSENLLWFALVAFTKTNIFQKRHMKLLRDVLSCFSGAWSWFWSDSTAWKRNASSSLDYFLQIAGLCRREVVFFSFVVWAAFTEFIIAFSIFFFVIFCLFDLIEEMSNLLVFHGWEDWCFLSLTLFLLDGFVCFFRRGWLFFFLSGLSLLKAISVSDKEEVKVFF